MLKRFLYIVLALAAFVALLIGPIDRVPLKEKTFYSEMMSELDTIQLNTFQATDTLQVGWSRLSITPDHSMPMAGYTPRDSFNQVHDTLYARILSINNGNAQVFMISLDLLLVPPILKKNIEERIRSQQKNYFVYFGATHTHNGLGGWQNTIGGRFIVGKYDEAWVNSLTENILLHMEAARTSMISTKISYLQADAHEYVRNRLAEEEGTKDGIIRGLKFERSDGQRAILFTYAAHATSISHLSRSLSGDYPAEAVNELTKLGWDFPMFMGGMVGSHTLTNVEGENFELTKNAGTLIATKIQESQENELPNYLPITTNHIPVKLGPSQLRVFDNWKLRDWVFKMLLGRLEAEITYLKLGDVLFLGTSCDFSGELSVNNKFDSLASGKHEHMIITSFNGNYTGYITEDNHYDTFSRKDEVRSMNWVGPHYGEYYSSIIERLMVK